MNEVFISYSTKERHQANAIRSYLQENGISCWMAPESIPTGSNYTKEIPVAIRNCKVFLLVLSEHSQKSPWVLRELDGAVNNGKYILPYLLDESPMEDEFQFLLTGCQWHPSWMEDALPRLVERILTLLPPREIPTPAKEVAPETVEPEVPVTPVVTAPPVTPVNPQAVTCPACGSHKTEPLKYDQKSYTGGENARLLLAWLAGMMAFGPIYYVIAAIMDAFGICSLYHSIYSIDTFTDLGYTILNTLSIIGAVAVGILCWNRIRRQIRQKRMQQGFRANGMVCRDCRKKFRITTPAMTRFPWEEAVVPGVNPTDTAVVRCPACGTYDVNHRKGGEGSWDKQETWTFLPAWLAGAVAMVMLPSPIVQLLKTIHLFVVSSTGRYGTLNRLGTVTAIVCTLAIAYGIVRLVRIPLKEIIRRKRVRKHIKACGFRCPHCDIRFRLVIPATRRFPWEQNVGNSTNTHLRQGK